MMTVLLESRAARGPRRTRWAVLSITLHAAVIAAAIVVTMQATGDATEIMEPPEAPIFIPMPPEPRARSDATGAPRQTAAPRPIVPISVPSIPTFEPSMPFSAAPLTERQIFGGGLPAAPVQRAGEAGNGVHTTGTVERVASALAGNGQPAYPGALRRANVEGEVLVRFVVDSTGRVEPGSISVVQATHPAFADAVRDWLPLTRYAPAEIGGRRVRQMVQQTIGFTLKR